MHTRISLSAVLIGCLMGLLWRCQNPTPTPPMGQWSDYYLPRHAKGFKIMTNGDSSVFRIILWQPNGIDTLKDWVISKGASRKTVCLSTTHLPMFQAIQALDTVVGVGFAHLVKNPDARKAIDAGKLVDINRGDDVSQEVMLSLNPDQFLVYSYGDKDYSDFQARGIEVIPIAEYLEKTPLGRTEWVVLIGVLAGQPDLAITTFSSIEGQYTDLRSRQHHSLDPTVFTGYYNSGNWYAPPGNSFVAQFLADAGARYILADSLSDENLIIPFEQMFAAMHQCDYWGKLSFTKEDPTALNFISDAPQLSALPAYQSKHLFYCNTQTTDYFGDAVMEPHVILRDLIQIFHPDSTQQHQAVYFKQVSP